MCVHVCMHVFVNSCMQICMYEYVVQDLWYLGGWSVEFFNMRCGVYIYTDIYMHAYACTFTYIHTYIVVAPQIPAHTCTPVGVREMLFLPPFPRTHSLSLCRGLVRRCKQAQIIGIEVLRAKPSLNDLTNLKVLYMCIYMYCLLCVYV